MINRNQHKSLAFIVFAAFLLYVPTIMHQFAWDDVLVMHGNELTKKGFNGIPEIWTNANYIDERPTYRPVPQTIFAIQWALAKNNPTLGHFINVVLYAVLVGVLFLLLLKIFSAYSPFLLSFIVLLFVLHPTHTEVVANIKSLDEILAALFSLLAIYFSLHQINEKYSKLKWSFVLLFLLLGILSKISALTIAPILLFTFYYFNKEILLVKAIESKHFLLTNKIKITEFFVVVAITLFFRFHFSDNISFVFILVLLLFYLVSFNSYWLLNFAFLAIGLGLFYTGFSAIFAILSLIIFYQLLKLKIDNVKFLLPLSIYISFLILYVLFKGNSWYYLPAFIALQLLVLLLFKLSNKLVKILAIVYFVLGVIFLILFYFQSNFYLLLSLPFLLLSIIYLYEDGSFPFLSFKTLKISASLFVLIIFVSSQWNGMIINMQEAKLLLEQEPEIIQESEVYHLDNYPYYNILVAAENVPQKFATIARIQLLYLQKLVFPNKLVHQHGVWQIEMASFKNIDVWLSIFLHLFLIVFAMSRIRKKCPVAIGILFYLITISIYTNIFRLMPDTMAERFLFLPSVGFCVAFVFGIYKVASKSNSKNALFTTGLVLLPFFLFFAHKSWSRSKDWKDNFTLTANTLPNAPNNAVINAQYAAEVKKLVYANPELALENGFSIDTAEKYFLKSLEIYPDFYNANSDLGALYIDLGEINKAFSYLRKAADINPKPWINNYYLGLIYYERTEYYKAMNCFTAVLENLDEDIAPQERNNTYEYLAKSLFQLNKTNELKTFLVENYDKYNEKSSMVLAGTLLAQKGKIDDALEIFYRLQNDFPDDEAIQPTINYLLEFKKQP